MAEHENNTDSDVDMCSKDTRDEGEEVTNVVVAKKKKVKKKEPKPGIIYLSRIPPFMTVKKVRHIFGGYGDIGRIFLQPNEKAPAKKKNRSFTEGWVEFLDKRVAKQVASALNNAPIGGKKRSRWHDELWNIKYLNSFKWGHLNERLAYERAVHKQRLRTEIAQVKRETNFYIQNVEKSKRLEKLEKRHADKGEELPATDRTWTFKQRETDESITAGQITDTKTKSSKDSKKPSTKSMALDKSFLKNIFSGGLKDENE